MGWFAASTWAAASPQRLTMGALGSAISYLILQQTLPKHNIECRWQRLAVQIEAYTFHQVQKSQCCFGYSEINENCHQHHQEYVQTYSNAAGKLPFTQEGLWSHEPQFWAIVLTACLSFTQHFVAKAFRKAHLLWNLPLLFQFHYITSHQHAGHRKSSLKGSAGNQIAKLVHKRALHRILLSQPMLRTA